jgi:leucyl-tRNA synthetase
MILGEGGVKMSKSLGNVINPDDIVRDFGADTMRVYEMFMGPLEVSKPWSTRGIAGAKRFLERIWRASELPLTDEEPTGALLRLLHKTIKKVSRDTDRLEFNTAIAQMMIFLNEAAGLPAMPRKLWEKLGNAPSIARVPWPGWIEELTAKELVEVVYQINGKIRAKESLPAGTADAELKERALGNERIREILSGREIRKVIVVRNKLVNIVAAV